MAVMSSVEQLVLYATCRVSAQQWAFIFRKTSLSKHFVAIGVRATWQKSLRQAWFDFFGTRMMVALFKQVVTAP